MKVNISFHVNKSFVHENILQQCCFKLFKTALLDLIKHNSKRLKAIPFSPTAILYTLIKLFENNEHIIWQVADCLFYHPFWHRIIGLRQPNQRCTPSCRYRHHIVQRGG